MKLQYVALFIAASAAIAACSGGGSSGMSPTAANGSARTAQCVPKIGGPSCGSPATPRPTAWPGFPNAIADGNFTNAEANFWDVATGSGFAGADVSGFWYSCAEDETTHAAVNTPTSTSTTNLASVPGPMTRIDTADFPPVSGLNPWSAQIGSSTVEAQTIDGGHQIVYGICYDFTVPAIANLNFWAKEITNEPAQLFPVAGFQTAEILAAPATGTFTLKQSLYRMQAMSGWTNYGFNLGSFSGQMVTLFFGVESPGSGTSLEQLIAGVSVGQGNPSPSPMPTAPPTPSMIYVSDRSSAAIIGFPLAANGNVAPSVTISGSNTQLTAPLALAVDAAGNIYTANDSDTVVRIFAAGSNGNIAPMATLGGSNTQIGPTEGIAIDHNGLLYVSSYMANTIVVFAAGATGNATPLRVISGSLTTLSGPLGMAFDASNNLYVDSGLNVAEFAAGASGNVAPIATIGGTSGNEATEELGLDSNGRVIVGSSCENGIEIFAPGMTTPVQTLTTPISAPAIACSIAYTVDSANNIYALSNTGNGNTGLPSGISVFPPTANGTITPARQIIGTNTAFNNPQRIVIH